MRTENDMQKIIVRAKNGDKKAMHEIVRQYEKLVHKICAKYINSGKEYEDLVQVGFMGLIKAVHNFKIELETAFITYAYGYIEFSIIRYLRDDGMIRVNREIKGSFSKICRFEEEYELKYKRKPNKNELAEYTGYSEKFIADVFKCRNLYDSFSKIVYDGDKEITLEEKLRDDIELEDVIFRKCDIDNLITYIDKLPENLRNVTYMRLQNMTQDEISKICGKSQVTISRWCKKSVKQLREMLRGKEEEFCYYS